MASVIDIGNTLKLRHDIDAGGKVTKWFRQGLNVVDILPAAFTIEMDNSNPFQMYNAGKPTLGIDPTVRFQKRCKQYGLKPDVNMLRLWLTGDSSFQEELSTTYQTNMFESLINSLTQKVNSLGDVGKFGVIAKRAVSAVKATANLAKPVAGSIGTDTASVAPDSVKKLASDATGLLSGIVGKTAAQAVGHLASALSSSILEYKFLSLPKIYTGSSYSPSLNFNIRLISPYGHPEAIQKFIVEPLTYLLLLASPESTNGVSYGGAPYVTIKAYGIADIDLGVIENISIKRGGNDVAYNKYRQPLSIDVNISIKPAADGFAVQMPDANSSYKASDISTVKGSMGSTDSKIALDIVNSPTPVNASKLGAKASFTTMSNILESFRPNATDPSQSTVTNTKPFTTSKPQVNTVGGVINGAANMAKQVTIGLNAMNNASKASTTPPASPTPKGALISDLRNKSKQAAQNSKNKMKSNTSSISTAANSGGANAPALINAASADTVATLNADSAKIVTNINSSKSANGVSAPAKITEEMRLQMALITAEKLKTDKTLQGLVNKSSDSQIIAALNYGKSAISTAATNLSLWVNSALSATPTAADNVAGLDAFSKLGSSASLANAKLDGIIGTLQSTQPSANAAEVNFGISNINTSVSDTISEMTSLATGLQGSFDPSGLAPATPISEAGSFNLNTVLDGLAMHLEDGQTELDSTSLQMASAPNLDISAAASNGMADMLAQLQQIADTTLSNTGANA